jgi:hypothetical protein
MGKDFAAERMAAAASELRDLVIDAWRSSADTAVGYPHVKVRDVEAGKVMPIVKPKGRDCGTAVRKANSHARSTPWSPASI